MLCHVLHNWNGAGHAHAPPPSSGRYNVDPMAPLNYDKSGPFHLAMKNIKFTCSSFAEDVISCH